MYRINLLKRNVLITTDEVIFHAPTKHTMDPRMIESSIIIAEERFIRPMLGYDYYQDLLGKKNLLITAGNKVAQQALIDASLPVGAQPVVLAEGDIINASEYLAEPEDLALWKQYLWKLAAEAVLLMALPEGFVQFASEGAVHMQPPAGPLNTAGLVTPELRSIKWSMDKKLMDRIDPLREALHLWICKQKKADPSKYALYTNACDCNADGVAYKRKTDIITGIYNDDDNSKCCE